MVKLNIIPPRISSVEELMAMAKVMEKEAARRYLGLSARMRLRGEDHLAELFAFLADIEEKHARKLDDQALERIAKPLVSMPIGWQVPETFDEEESASRLLTPYRALALAVRNEDRAFAFYTYVAADAPDEATRILAEDMAKDELEHAHLLRRERRIAFRRERSERRQGAGRGVPRTMREFWSLSAEEESRAARYHRALASSLVATDAAAATLFTRTAEDEDLCARDAESRGGIARSIAPQVIEPNIEDGLRLLEESFKRYADIAEHAKDEAVMLEAQRLAERSVKRLSLVCGSLEVAAFGDANQA
jgi:rubrerythrin